MSDVPVSTPVVLPIEEEYPPSTPMYELPPDVELRRKEVVRLRLRRMSQLAIASLLGVDQSTISRDLRWIRQHWKEKYGSPRGVSPEHELGEAVAMYEDTEQSALMEFHMIQQAAATRKLSPMFVSRQRMACLRTALVARRMRIELLQENGLIDRKLGTLGVDHTMSMKADEIRNFLQEEGMLDQKRLPAQVPEDEAAPPDPVAQWIMGESVD
jgi:predicted transcriptional regulator